VVVSVRSFQRGLAKRGRATLNVGWHLPIGWGPKWNKMGMRMPAITGMLYHASIMMYCIFVGPETQDQVTMG
jgi:hypothetical protein